jgi:hypothetical protein
VFFGSALNNLTTLNANCLLRSLSSADVIQGFRFKFKI